MAICEIKIYLLRNPNDNSIFYVGQTADLLSSRLNGHVYEALGNPEKGRKNKLIASLLSNNQKPIIEEIESHSADQKNEALHREKYWISFHKASGCDILNIAGLSETYHLRPVEPILIGVKEGYSREDAFKALQKKMSEERKAANEKWIEENYDNPEFIRITYHAIYRDSDPDYYDQNEVLL